MSVFAMFGGTMRRIALAVLLGSATLALLQAQPTINAPSATPPGLQSDTQVVTSPSLPRFGAAITTGNKINQFTLYINGTFNISNIPSVQWVNPTTSVSHNFTI